MDYLLLKNTALFSGISAEEIPGVLKYLNAARKSYLKNNIILRRGEPVLYCGLVITGSVNVESNDLWGNRSILDNIGPGQVFAENYACLPGERLMVDVLAAGNCEILFLEIRRLLTPGPVPGPCHDRLIRNLLTVTAGKNLNLTRKIFHTAPKTIRDRLLSYLSFQSVSQGSHEFVIPYNRQQLADYLGVDRSAMSGELSKMQRDGLLEYSKNRFVLNVKPDA